MDEKKRGGETYEERQTQGNDKVRTEASGEHHGGLCPFIHPETPIYRGEEIQHES
jgi:hypothetical protein